MNDSRWKKLLRVSAACAICAWLAGCATTGETPGATLTKATAVPERAASAGILIGKSTKADVIAALGRTTAITFDTGFEVWVYHLAGGIASRAQAGKTELVLLFAPSGVLAKTRVRTAPPFG